MQSLSRECKSRPKHEQHESEQVIMQKKKYAARERHTHTRVWRENQTDEKASSERVHCSIYDNIKMKKIKINNNNSEQMQQFLAGTINCNETIELEL